MRIETEKMVSVIVPVYNVEAYIGRCLDSLLSQTQQGVEILVIDDGSTDGSGGIVSRYESENPEKIRAFHVENRGVSAARNLGVSKASGKYLTFIDSDDYVTEDYLESMVRTAEEHQSDLVVQGFQMVSEEGKILSELIPLRYVRGEHEEWPQRIISAWGRLFCREFWIRHELRFPEGVRAEDAPVNLIANAMADNIQVVPRAGYRYFQHSASAMHNFKGLQKYQLPYESLEEALKYVQHSGLRNGREFYELNIMRILAFWVFEFARGSSPEKIRELCGYCSRMMRVYVPRFMKNRYVNPFRKLDVPFIHRLSIFVFALLCKLRLLTPVIRIYSKVLR